MNGAATIISGKLPMFSCPRCIVEAVKKILNWQNILVKLIARDYLD